ncbi:hypothetical protein J7M28_04800 [bacterium]|nr:hypothetical protein [bacterium]
MFIDGFQQLASFKIPIAASEADVSVEYCIGYGVTDVATEGRRATVSLSAQITPGGYALPYPIDVYPKSGQAPHRAVVFIGPDSGDYGIEVPFADVFRIVGNPETMLLVADSDQEDMELYCSMASEP